MSLVLKRRFVIAVFLVGGTVAAFDVSSRRLLAGVVDNEELPDLKEVKTSGPYCGIYCLMACLKSVGLEPQISDLWKGEYVGSGRGSTAAELMRAAQDCGGHATAFRHLTHRELARSRFPMLLHVRTNWNDAEYDHWVAFLGVDGDRIRILDPPFETQSFSAAEVLANWDGFAIEVSRKPIGSAVLRATRYSYALVVGAIGLVVLICKSIPSKTSAKRGSSEHTPAGRLAARIGGILAVSFVLAILWHVQSEVGFFSNPMAVAEVSRRYHSVTIPEIARPQMEEIVANGSAIVFDARRSADFRSGAIPGARSFPVNSTLPERRDILRGVGRSDRIILYCQSATCSYGSTIAKFLKFNGYDNLAIYRGGYREWSRVNPNVGQTQTAARPTE